MTASPIRRAEYQITGAIGAGSVHGVTLKADGTVWSFGGNGNGQLGNGTTTTSSTPVQASGRASVVNVSGGGDANTGHSLAVKSDGKAWAWGLNNLGQLGDGSTTQRTTPVEVSTLTNVQAVADRHLSLALKHDGTVWAWGRNAESQLGDGGTTQRTTPLQVPGLGGVTAIAAGGYHTRVLRTDGAVTGSMCVWGGNADDALGTGGSNSAVYATPVKVLANTAVVASKTETYAPAERAKSQGLSKLLVVVTLTFTSATLGWLVARSGWLGPNYVAIPLIAIAGVAILWLMARRRATVRDVVTT